MRLIFIKLELVLAGWTLLYCSLKKISCPRLSLRPIRYEERLLDFGCLRTKSCIRDLFLDHICYAYTLKQLNYSWKSYIRDVWKSHRRQILILQSPHPGILVAKYVEGGTSVCEEMRLMPKIYSKHSSIKRSL